MMKEINYIKDYQYYANKIKDNTGNEVCSVAYKPEYYTRTSFEEIDDCEVNIKSIPEEKYYYTYQFLNVSLRSYKGSTLTWKLVYKDQYGRGDTLNIKTKIDSYESHDKSITKCYNAISNEKGYGNYCKFDEEISPEAKKYKNPRCMIHKKTGTCFCDEGPILELI